MASQFSQKLDDLHKKHYINVHYSIKRNTPLKVSTIKILIKMGNACQGNANCNPGQMCLNGICVPRLRQDNSENTRVIKQIPVFTLNQNDGQYFNNPLFVVEDISNSINPFVTMQSLVNNKYSTVPYIIVSSADSNIGTGFPSNIVANIVNEIVTNVPFDQFIIGQSGYVANTSTQLGTKTTNGPNFVYNPLIANSSNALNTQLSVSILTPALFNTIVRDGNYPPMTISYILSGDGNPNLFTAIRSKPSNDINPLSISRGSLSIGNNSTNWGLGLFAVVLFIVILGLFLWMGRQLPT